MWSGESALTTRWASETLALTHLLTTGFMLQAMFGALLQFVPVAAGGNVDHAGSVATLVHPVLILATLLLAGGFLSGNTGILLAALPLFTVAGIVFIASLWRALQRVSVAGATLSALKLALFSLAVTLFLGIVLALGLSEFVGGTATSVLPLLEIASVHVAFGLGGWGLVLLLGVSLYVVPMFQLTPPYPALFARHMPRLIVLVAMASALPLIRQDYLRSEAVTAGLFLLAALYAMLTIRLQMQRRRRLTDPSFWFFRGGMLAVLFAALLAALPLTALFAEEAANSLAIGILLLSAFVSVISGMMYKIVPFINWLHLQRLTQRVSGIGSMPPNMRLMIPEVQARRQMVLHFSAVALLVLAVVWPALSRVAGLLWTASFAWLGINLIGGARRYADFRDQILASAEHR